MRVLLVLVGLVILPPETLSWPGSRGTIREVPDSVLLVHVNASVTRTNSREHMIERLDVMGAQASSSMDRVNFKIASRAATGANVDSAWEDEHCQCDQVEYYRLGVAVPC